MWRQLVRGLRTLANRADADRNVAEEIDGYLDEAAAAFEAGGLTPDDARLAARRELGSATAVRERVRASGWEHAVETVFADVRYAARGLRRDRSFALVAALTLALGIGATAAIFSVVNPVLLQPLPYPQSERLMMIWDGAGGTRLDVTFGTFRELAARNRSFDALAVMRPWQPTLTGSGEPERLDGQRVTAGYFRTLGITPALGREFLDADDRPGSPEVVLISDALWRRRFARDPGVIGRPIALDGGEATVIGVLPEGFRDVLGPSAVAWSPLRYDPALPLDGREWGHHLRLVGRLSPAAGQESAARELDEIARTKLPGFPRPQRAAFEDGLVVIPLQDDLTREVRPALLAIFGAALLLLALACVNVTSLLLARGAGRQAELAMRAALGASRPRLVRQLLLESLAIAVSGGLLGGALAYAAVGVIGATGPPRLPRAATIGVDAWTLGFAAALTAAVGLIVGIAAAMHGTGARMHATLQQRSGRAAGSSPTARRALVVVQVALAIVLLVAAGLLLRTVQHLLAVPPGFDAAHVLTLQVQAAGLRARDDAATHRFFAEALEAVRRVPGVSGAALTSQLPLTGDSDVWGLSVESAPVPEGAAPDAYRHGVSPGYFRVMGIPLRSGRLLEERDAPGAPLAAVISESIARSRLPGVNPIGRRLRIGGNTGPWFTVVGVAGDVKHTSLALGRSDAVYVPADQWPFADRARWLVVRAPGDVAALAPAIRRAIWSVDKDQPILRIGTMEDRVAASVADRRFALLLFEAFGLAALALAAIGTYGLIAGQVTERTREIGVRRALGARRRSVIALVFRQGMSLTVLGVALGLAGAAAAGRALETLLFGVTPLDTATHAGVVLLLGAVSALACGMPAWRAAGISPSIALRSE